MSQLTIIGSFPAPALVAAAGDRGAYRFLEFFTAQIRNHNTRRAYAKAVSDFCAWMEARGLPSITAVGSIHIAAYVEELGSTLVAARELGRNFLGMELDGGHHRTACQRLGCLTEDAENAVSAA